MSIKLKDFIFILIDFFTFFFSLFLALFIRNFPEFSLEIYKIHFFPFLIIFFIWFLIFYIFDLYNIKKISSFSDFSKNYLRAIFISLFLTILVFYTLPIFKISPKTLLVLFIIIFIILNIEFRNLLLNKYLFESYKKIALIGETKDIEEIKNYLENHKSLGFKEIAHYRNFNELINQESYDYYVVASDLLRDEDFSSNLVNEILKGKLVLSSLSFFEIFINKIPVGYVNEEWVLDNLYTKDQIYEVIKRGIDIILALIVIILSLPLLPFIILGIKISSKGPIFFKDKRVGYREKIFTLYKFRTMHEIDYKDPQKEEIFGVKEGDKRIFPFGKILRKFHLDEIPQVINVLKNDISFIGPRPDSLKYYEFLKKKIPHYTLRTLIKPGISGWAQINEKTGDTLEEAKERLAYDLFYLKNRNLVLDFIIILKTLRVFLTFWGK